MVGISAADEDGDEDDRRMLRILKSGGSGNDVLSPRSRRHSRSKHYSCDMKSDHAIHVRNRSATLSHRLTLYSLLVVRLYERLLGDVDSIHVVSKVSRQAAWRNRNLPRLA